MTASDAMPSMASWYRSLSSIFPLITFESAQRRSNTDNLLQRPILYVAQGHPSSSKKETSSSNSWASRDPRCLAWQMQLLFRGIEFDSVQVHDDENFLRSTFPGEGFTNVPVLLDCDRTVVSHRHLDRWADTMQPFPHSRSAPFSSSSSERTIEGLLQGPLLAGVLLEILLLPDPLYGKSLTEVPLLTRQVQRTLVRDRKLRTLAKISALRHQSPTSHVPGWLTTMHGLLNTGGMMDIGAASEVNDEEHVKGTGAQQTLEVEQLDIPGIRQDAREAIQAISVLTLTTQDEEEWVCNAKGPSHLDALLFALLHTIMSLPVPHAAKSKKQSETSLREMVQASPNLCAYMRRIWQQYVKPLGG